MVGCGGFWGLMGSFVLIVACFDSDFLFVIVVFFEECIYLEVVLCDVTGWIGPRRGTVAGPTVKGVVVVDEGRQGNRLRHVQRGCAGTGAAGLATANNIDTGGRARHLTHPGDRHDQLVGRGWQGHQQQGDKAE